MAKIYLKTKLARQGGEEELMSPTWNLNYPKITMISVMLYVTLSIIRTLAFAQTVISDIAKKVVPSVVTVNVFNREGKWRGGGTGFFVHGEGLLVTNHRVIDGKIKAKTRLPELENNMELKIEIRRCPNEIFIR